MESTLKLDHTLHVSAPDEQPPTNDNILSLQVRAFLAAAEDVDFEMETLEELLQTVENCESGRDSEVSTNRELNVNEDEDESDNDVSADELDISPLYDYRFEQEVKEWWTKQEVEHMLHYLKERGMSAFHKEYVVTRCYPIYMLLQAFGVHLCPQLQNKSPKTMLFFLRVAMSHHLRMRDKLTQYSTISDAVQLIKASNKIVILTGAGISVSCGIPDFRSRDGLYASLKDRGDYDLDDPQQMFDINYFKENPAVFYSFASKIYPSNFIPSPCHRFIKAVEDRAKLLRNYTQNIDTLESLAGVKNVLQCHGSFATASCLLCRRCVPGVEIEADILRQRVPLCTVCNSTPEESSQGKKKTKKSKKVWNSDEEDESDGPLYPPGIMKPDITFFGEKLTDNFDRSLAEDRDKVDLLLVIGTSLKVSPVAEILSHLPHSIPQILINKTPIRHINPDIVLLGNADGIVEHLSNELEWELPPPCAPAPSVISISTSNGSCTRLQHSRENPKKRSLSDLPEPGERRLPQRVGESHVWLFDGAEGGKWLQDLRRELSIPASGNPSVSNKSRAGTRTSTPSDSSGKNREVKKQKMS